MSNNAILSLGLVVWFATLAAAEFLSARRGARTDGTSDARLATNFGLGLLVVLAGALLPAAKMGFSLISEAFGIGLVPRFPISWPAALALFLFVDSLTSYCVHRTMHSLPLFWRIHRVHHADIAVDISTSLRNHPLELAITMPVFALWASVIGAPADVVAVAQTIALAAAMGQHADISFPPRLDRLLSLIIVTPNMHRLHHSPHRIVHDGNYGDLITLWDHLFGTFRRGELRAQVGLDGQVARPDGLVQQIWSPIYAA